MAEKTIALIESLDTKKEEAFYAKSFIEENGFGVFLIDNSTKGLESEGADISPLQILSEAGVGREQFEALSKAERIETMWKALIPALTRFYGEGRFAAVLSIGGGQNATMAAPAMKGLPFGVPKIIASSLACGVRTMEQFVGEKDIFVIPTVADIAGLNAVTKTLIGNVCSAAMGLARYGKVHQTEPGKQVIAATMLGVTTKGTEHALRLISEKGNFEPMVFHANGVGGRCMESLIGEARIDAVLDMTLHEIVCEIYGGYCSGAKDRLLLAIEKGLPMAVVPGGLDMIDFFIDEKGNSLPPEIDRRKRVYHNSSICHCKLYPEEASFAAKLVCERLNRSRRPVALVVPERGCCETSAPGGALYDPETDRAMVAAFRRYAGEQVRLTVVDANISDDCFAEAAAMEFLKILEL
jgi:uncharacterized protein (UPF0261 family)